MTSDDCTVSPVTGNTLTAPMIAVNANQLANTE